MGKTTAPRKRKPANPPRHQHGFVQITHLRCPACEDRGALRNDGGVRVVSGGQLRPKTKDVGITTAAAGCEVCKGKGSLELDELDPRRVDPYARKQ